VQLEPTGTFIGRMSQSGAVIQNVRMESEVLAATSFWRAVALLRLERPAGLAALESVFAAGRPPTNVRGPLRGRFLASTIGHHIDPAFEALTSIWLPWKGKTFDPDAEEGRNLFTAGARRMMRVTLPTYATGDEPGGCSAFRFLTSMGPSAFTPGVDVLRIDYRDVPENPSWPVRRILDELVMIEDGRYLGQALIEFRGSLRRAAWFCLEDVHIVLTDHAS
jgi:hypothetical protein